MKILELLKSMPERGASDLFVVAEKTPCVRLKNVIERLDMPPFVAAEIDSFRKSVLLSRAEDEFLQSGDIDFGLSLGASLRFRINFFRQKGQPGFVARLVPSGELDFAALSLPAELEKFASLPRGLILVVGPAGSGKSTTMAAILNYINRNFAKHIITIEDPIEFVHSDCKSVVTQREIGTDTLDFARALKHVVRESPDVIFIGEMRDLDTMQTAINAALTGHLVVSSLHTSNCVQCVERIVNHFPEQMREQAAADLAIALEGIIAQKLVRRADGKGLIPTVEMLKASPLVRLQIGQRNYSDLEDTLRHGREEGTISFARALANLCKSGKITIEEGAKAASNREEFLLITKGMETGIDTFRGEVGEESQISDINMKKLLHSAVANSASDLIITAGSSPCLRIDGDIIPLEADVLSPSDTKRMLFSILNSKQREIFEEKKEIDFALSAKIRRSEESVAEDTPFRFRINGFYQRGNVAVAVRVIPKKIPTPEELGLPPVLVTLAKKKQGLILITGPTGHGKSTTMAALIDVINQERPCHIITVEDPIEYVHTNKKAIVEQREVFADTLSFANALKYVLRQDPDVILVGEMRDQETIAAALTAAETGHLVIATLHTNSAPQSVDRIIDSFPAHQQNQIRIQLAGSVLAIVAQRLVQRRDGKGRIAAFEVMVGSSAIRNLIREGKTHLIPSVMETSAKDGMITMDKSLHELYEKNLIRRQDAAVYMTSSHSRD